MATLLQPFHNTWLMFLKYLYLAKYVAYVKAKKSAMAKKYFIYVSVSRRYKGWQK